MRHGSTCYPHAVARARCRALCRAANPNRSWNADRGGSVSNSVHASLEAGLARADLELRGELAERTEAAAHAHVDLDLRSGEFSLTPGSTRVDAMIDTLKLDRLRLWLAQVNPELTVGGTLDLKAELSGSAASPEITVEVHGRQLQAGGHEIGALDLQAALPRHGDAQLALRLARRGGVLIVDGQVLRIRLNLVDGGLRWSPRELHQLRVEATRITLRRQLEGLVEASKVPLTGVFDLDLSVAGPMAESMLDALVADLRLRGHRLTALGLELGDVDVRGHVERDHATAELDLAGPLAEKLSVHAEVPLRIAPAERDVRWLPEREHILTVDGRSLDLSRLKAFSPNLKLRGLVLGFTLTARTGPDGYSSDLAVRGSIAHRDVGAMPIRLDATVKPTEQNLRVDFGPLRKVGDLHVEVITRADIDALLAGRAKAPEIPIKAAVRIAGLGLGVLKPILPTALCHRPRCPPGAAPKVVALRVVFTSEQGDGDLSSSLRPRRAPGSS